jgi:hypothetical protein
LLTLHEPTAGVTHGIDQFRLAIANGAAAQLSKDVHGR